MKLIRLLPFAVVTVLATGCLQPEKQRLAQLASLEDSIRFTQLSVSGDLVTLKISRMDPKLPNTRATGADPIEFPEYASFRITSEGLKSIPAQTHLYIPVSDAKCEDTECKSLSFTMKRPGGTVSDTAHLRSKRISDVKCSLWIREPNGADATTNPVFASATLTSVVAGNSEGRYSFWGQSSSILPNGYHATTFLRTVSGVPSELWIDEIDTSLNSGGQSVPVGTTVRTFDADGMVVGGSALNLTAADDAGRRVQLGCAY